MNNIEKLSEVFKKFPGIGQRQAKRFVYFLLSKDDTFIKTFTELIVGLKQGIHQCPLCFSFFATQGNSETCDTCISPNTDKTKLMVVEKDVDLENIKRLSSYTGAYFVLGGNIPILEQEPAKKVRAKQLFISTQKRAKEGLKEIILAFSVNPEGDNTTQYIKKILEPLASQYNLKISTLGRGLSTGTELEYSDSSTFESALQNRK